MNNIELSFKSIENSINKDDKDWAVLSIKLTTLNASIKFGCKYFLYRKIAYIDRDNKTYQTGCLYVPINNLKSISFFLRLIFSGKTFGHFVDSNHPNQSRISLIESNEIKNSNNLLFDRNSSIRISKRLILIPTQKFKFYVEEELEIL